MLTLGSSVRVFLALGATDLRRSFDGLSGRVREVLRQEPLSGDWFVFCNRSRNRIRILYFDGSGLWVFAKRLEQGTFAWPSDSSDRQTMELTAQELSLLLAGIDLKSTKKRPWYDRETKRRRRKRSA